MFLGCSRAVTCMRQTVFSSYCQLNNNIIPVSNKIPSRAMSIKEQETIGNVKPTQRNVELKLEANLQPTYLKVINESYMHNVPKGSESHFKVVVVSDKFTGLTLIKRHRLVMDVLSEEIEGDIHAISIQAKTPLQWKTTGGTIQDSPPCLGGFKH